MQKTRFTRSLSLILCALLIAAMALFAYGCTDSDKNTDTTVSTNEVETPKTSLGTGNTRFSFTVVDADGKETKFEINTDKTTVGEALLELNLIEGESGPYGLYVKTVNGVTLDYDKDGKYWAFYTNGEYAITGVDMTKITAGAEYSFKAE